MVKLSALGDVVQTIPAFEALRRHFAEAHIAWLVEEQNADLLVHYPGLDEVLVLPRRSWRQRLTTAGSWLTLMRQVVGFCRELRQRDFDIVIDFQGLLKSAVWVALARGNRKIGFDRTREASWLVLNERLPAYDPDRHALERYLDIVGYLGASVKGVSIQDPWTTAEEHRFERRLWPIIQNGGRLVTCHPTARWSSKLWPEENFATLAKEMVEELEVEVVFTGSTGDRSMVSRIIRQAGDKGLHNWAGTTSLRELAYLFRQAETVVSTDSGPMHLAAALGTPVVALFGPTAPWRTGPYGEGHKVLRTGVECSPCFQKTCDSRECMVALPVNDVLQAVAEQLEKE
jgi:lipopolysaccharide heptosyltransferase I